MKLTNLEHAIEDRNFKEIRAHFEAIDGEDSTVLPWVDVLGLSRNPWAIGLAHRVRNKIQSALNDYFGHQHLSESTFQATAFYKLQGITESIEAAKEIRRDLNSVHQRVNNILIQ